MKNIIIALFISSSASLFAADWSTKDFILVESHKDSEEVTIDTLKDAAENMITVTYTGEVAENVMGIIKKLNDDFREWKYMKVDYIKFSVINDEIQVLVSPREFTYNDENILDHISSGILFTYRVNLMYNFRVLVDKLFVPIKGIFIDEKSFNEKIISAIKDPTTYINARDPEYLLESLEQLSANFERLRSAYLASMNFNKLIDKEIIDKVLAVKSEHPDYTYKEIFKDIKENSKEMKINQDLVRNILKVYYNEF